MKIRYGDSPLAPKRARFGQIVTPGRVVFPKRRLQPNLPPIHFYAQGDVLPSGEATLASQALTNKTGRPIEIHEIRMTGIPIQSSTSELASVDVGGLLRYRITVSGKPVTNAFVPMWLMGKTEQGDSHAMRGYVNFFGSTFANEGGSLYVWRLSRPWYFPPGAVVEVQVQNTGGVNFPVRCGFGLAGCFTPRRATSAALPYAAAYVSKAFTYTAADGSGHDFHESSERDLANITTRALNIERIIGRVGVARANGGVAGVSTFDDCDNESVVVATRLRLQTSKTIPIIRDYTSFRAVFGDQRSMDFPFQLDAGDFLKASIDNLDGTVVGQYATYNAQAHISIVGWREEGV